MLSAGPTPSAATPSSSSPHPSRWPDVVWLAVLAAWSAAWCLTAAPKLGVTYDEPFYLDAGMDAWRGWVREDGGWRGWAHGSCAVNGVMPLPIDALTLPLFVYECRTGEKFGPGESKIEKLRWARAVTLGWFWLLIFSGWRLGRAVGGPWAGRIAAGLLATDPNFLGHASVATTDICVCATLMAYTRAVYAGQTGGCWKRLLLPGLWFGVAAVSKLSALLYGGIILVVLEVCFRCASGALSRPSGGDLKAWGRKVAGAVLRSVLNAAGVLAVGIAFAFAFLGVPDEDDKPFVKVAASVPAGEPLKERYAKWAEGIGSGQVPYAACAFAFQWWHNAQGRPTFLDGVYYPESYRWYFPHVLLMKVPLPIFALALVALLRARAVANPLTFAALLLLAALLTAKLQIGVRLAFPVVAIGYVALAVALARGYPRCATRLAAPAVLALAATSLWVWPHGLGYINQAHGGPKEGYRLVTDSNVDWGHGLPELKEWHAANGEPPICVWYFGTDPAVNQPPFQKFSPESFKPAITNERELRAAVGSRVLAVGHTVASLHPDAPPEKVVALGCLKARRPVARTATFTLYDFRDGQNGSPALE
ncbi:hypothetical protein GobsT_19790 [Gemmata obscuriglobus]|nr:hypothetical protein GobsT_19790 [Gemmata obscuriglobus]VTS03964.1 4-amino-4-deoxy-L-arabinose transferase OS=Desulfatibacillum alkenivorans (strain AK-01) GN=Dalk_3255 PE=4 SV=1: PMT_2 [Gemmata obscuriglobus UQM 2246]